MTDQYTPSPGDLVQLKSGSSPMTAGESEQDGTALMPQRTWCWYDGPDGPRRSRIPTDCLEPAELEEPSDARQWWQDRVDALREALRSIAASTGSPPTAGLANRALASDDALAAGDNDEDEEM